MTWLTALMILNGLACLIWLYLLFFNGWFWLAGEKLENKIAARDEWPEIIAVIPARNEADTIGAVLKSHLETDYPGRFSVIVIDDQSEDETGSIIRAFDAENVHIIEGKPLPEGWSGKLWAVHNGLMAVDKIAPDAGYVLLSDADIMHEPHTLRRLLQKAVSEKRALVSVMAHLDARGLWGSLLMPAFIFFFQKLYPFPLTNSIRKNTAGAAGGCMLVERQALHDIGGVAYIRGDLIDDCAFAAAIKGKTGKRRSIWLGFDRGVISLRDNRKFASIWNMVTRTAYTQLGYSPLVLLGVTLGMILTYLIAPISFLTFPFHGSMVVLALASASWLASIIAYAPTLIRYHKSLFLAILLPFTVVIYLVMTIASAIKHWYGSGGSWKGRTYS